MYGISDAPISYVTANIFLHFLHTLKKCLILNRCVQANFKRGLLKFQKCLKIILHSLNEQYRFKLFSNNRQNNSHINQQ